MGFMKLKAHYNSHNTSINLDQKHRIHDDQKYRTHGYVKGVFSIRVRSSPLILD